MVLHALQWVENLADSTISEWCTPVGEFLDEHPELYKVCVVAIHVFRAVGMFALMSVSPLGVVVTSGLMLGFSFIYRAAVERFCPWKFTLPSAFGALAIWAAKAAVIAIVSKAIFTSPLVAIGAALGCISLVVYAGYICYLSNKDVESYFERKHSGRTSTHDCCGNN